MIDVQQLLKDCSGLEESGEYIALRNILPSENLHTINNSELYTYRGVSEYFTDNFEEAIVYLSTALEIDPTSEKAFFYRGCSLFAIKRYREAIDDFTQLINSKQNVAVALYNRGLSYHFLKEYDNAIADYNSITDHSKELPPGLHIQKIYLSRAKVFYSKEDYENSRADYAQVLKYYPENVEALSGIASISLQKKAFQAAVEEYTILITRFPHNPNFYYERGRASSKIQNYQMALEDYTKAIELEPSHASAYGDRGLLWLDFKDVEKALMDFDQSLKINPDNPIVLCNKAQQLLFKNNFTEAIEYYSRSIDLEKDYPDAFINRGAAYLTLGKFDMALDDLNQAIKLSDKSDLAYFNRASVYLKMGLHHLALSNFKKAYFLNKEAGSYFKVFSNTYPSPFIVEEITQSIVCEKQLLFSGKEILQEKKSWERWSGFLNYSSLLKKTCINPVKCWKLEAVVSYYMGHNEKAFLIYKNQIKSSDLEIRDLYYYVLSAAGFLEPFAHIIDLVYDRLNQNEILDEEAYYVGQICMVNMELDKAELYFKKAKGFLPAQVALIGLYNLKYQQQKQVELIECINNTSRDSIHDILLKSHVTIYLKSNTSIEEFETRFSEVLYFYELIEPINTINVLTESFEETEFVDFSELLNYEKALHYSILEKIDVREIRKFELELINLFMKNTNTLKITELNTEIENNNDAKLIILQIEHNCLRFNTSAEKELAIAMSLLKEPSRWYLLLIKYLYLSNKLEGHSAIILHFYLLQKAIEKNDIKVVESLKLEIQTWLPILSFIYQSPFIFKLISRVWNYIQNGDTPKIYNQYLDYKEFKSKFRTVFLPWWRDLLLHNDLKDKSFDINYKFE